MIINSHFKTIKQKNKNNLKSFKTLKKNKKKLKKTYTKILWTQNCTLDHFQRYTIISESADTILYPHTNLYPTLILNPCMCFTWVWIVLCFLFFVFPFFLHLFTLFCLNSEVKLKLILNPILHFIYFVLFPFCLICPFFSFVSFSRCFLPFSFYFSSVFFVPRSFFFSFLDH